MSEAIEDAYQYGRKITPNLEVIAVHGGPSSDHTYHEILLQKKKYKDLIVLDQHDNVEGYAVIKWGFKKATKEWVFYTDGDLQYDVADLEKFVANQIESQADIVNGYRLRRNDPYWRVLLGALYNYTSNKVFRLPIRDLTCDSRLIRASLLKQIDFTARDSSIILELILNLKRMNAKFCEMPVKHYARRYGVSTYSIGRLLKDKIFGDFLIAITMWFKK